MRGIRTMKTLDTKELRIGMRVIKISGSRQNTTATVRAIDVGNNMFGAIFNGDKTITQRCDPKEFEILKLPNLRLTGTPPPGTEARRPPKSS
ncbi:MAG: hypothetical protein UY03_C0024G0008 [Parcubacteria group bacterium GW2011_GWA2_47_64]|nr:MAG: hypothetical protein UY03_C0024G0008 [Parcubacteria group bacterium GW2011_GWA2_47_64]KKU97023.1 MAG: hypothetical protein UY29_C0003G0020 [Parcubacteria group bacterium GW2011_GWC2_48_17]